MSWIGSLLACSPRIAAVQAVVFFGAVASAWGQPHGAAAGRSPSPTEPRASIVQSLEVRGSVAPWPVRIAGRRILAYELHLTNLRSFAVDLTRIEVLDADSGARLADYRGAALAAMLGRPGLPAGSPDRRVIGGGMHAVVYVWMAVGACGPAQLRHRIEFESATPSGRERGAVESVLVTVVAARPVALGPPVRGGPWVALYDPSLVGGHRTSIYTIDGRARIPARFAVDLVKLGRDGSPSRGDRSKVAGWHGYGADVLAVADAVVDDVRDDMPGADSIGASQGRMPLENTSGNYVTLALGGGLRAFYEHLEHGSIRVAIGQRVARGQVIARLGNTGSSSSGPHLHFHVADDRSALAAEGMPFELTSFRVLGAYDSIAAAMSGRAWTPAPRGSGGARLLELPAANAVLWFPERSPAQGATAPAPGGGAVSSPPCSTSPPSPRLPKTPRSSSTGRRPTR